MIPAISVNPAVSKPPARPTSFLGETKFPFCKGCSHTSVLRSLNDALVTLQYDPHDVALVTDIGCIGLADGLFESLHTVHTTHGRSTAFATGIALADSLLAERRLKTVVLIGDGGAMIGLQHLVHAAMLNVDVTVLICNNFVYGMTGGQGSSFTPEHFVTATTPGGNIVPPADLCEILRSSNAPFVARVTATDKELPAMIRRAVEFPGFAAIEILELCTEFAVPANELTGRKLVEEAQKNGWRMGILAERTDRKQFAERYERGTVTGKSSERGEVPEKKARSLRMHQPLSLVIAGSAGEGVQSAASLLCQAALREHLYVTQKNDNPVTQGSGFSLSEVWISSRPVGFTGIDQPDCILVTSEQGLRELEQRDWLENLGPKTRVYMDASIGYHGSDSRVKVVQLRTTFGSRLATIGGLAVLASREKLVDLHRLTELVFRRYGEKSGSVLVEGLRKLEAIE